MKHFEHMLNPIEKGMQDKQIQSLFEEKGKAENCQKGQMIYLQGESAHCFYYLKAGTVRVFLTSEAGEEKTIAVQKKGSVFGEAAFFDGLPRVSSAKAMENSQIMMITRPILLGYFRENPNMALEMLEYLARTVRMLSNQMDNMVFLQADQRIASLLLSLSCQEKSCSLHYTHEEIANLAGVSRVTVSRVLSNFAKRGWIHTQYRQIQVLDEQALSIFIVESE